MTKLLNARTINQNSMLLGLFTAAVRFGRDMLTHLKSVSSDNASDRLPERLRYDIGTLDLNPDCQPRSPRSGAPRQHIDHLRAI